MNTTGLKYPIGRYEKPEVISEEMIKHYIKIISDFPERLQKEIKSLSDDQLDTVYRPDGWTIRQLINHCADSHSNSLTRFKLALTEENPVIRPYYEDRWAELCDSKNIPVEPALKMLEGIHERWTILLKSLTPEQLSRTFIHPDSGNTIRLDENIGIYAWHCDHHLRHITSLKERKGWE
ncbi:MAG TPA: putative metal-dependent hydrolase [Ignavibacteria bacterium]|nr:putative metal-dependent hydrolase [Ignavibacteria bacterium]HMR40395.1 putative metal-dependent hydrolase [Ignavibacteria bacterium]